MIENSAVFFLGVVSSLHCLGMCGPIALSLSSYLSRESGDAAAHSTPAAKRSTLVHLFYNAGRIVTYSFLGGVAGLLGSTLELGLWSAGIAYSGITISLITGGAMLLLGLIQLGVLPRLSVLDENFFHTSPLFSSAVTGMMHADALWTRFVLGLLLGFLPCILTYSMFLQAIASGGFWKGFQLLFFFGLGTAPMLLLTGFFSAALTRSLRRYGNRLSGWLILLVGIATLIRGIFFPHGGH
jgi:uncharacterized protein